jgi:MFS family permease
VIPIGEGTFSDSPLCGEAIGSRRLAKRAVAGLSLMMLMPSLATSIANAALPVLTRTFAASFQAAQWIVLAYLLAITVSVLIVGRLGDLLGRRRLALAGIAIFAASSLLCGVAPTLPFLVVARAVQGVGAAVMMALTMALVGDIVPKARLGRTMGLLGTMSAAGTTLGPSLGGILTAFAGWPAIFLINVPLGVLAFTLARYALPAETRLPVSEGRRFDFAGIALLSITLCAYALAMTIGRGGFGPLTLAFVFVALGAGGCFLVVETKVAAPLLRLSLFRRSALATGLAAGALISAVMMAMLIAGPFYLSGALGLKAAQLGIVLSVGPLVATLAGMPSGRLVDSLGVGRMGIAGLIAILVGLSALCLASRGLGIWGYIFPMTLMTSGYALFQAANNKGIMADAPQGESGLVSGMLNLSRNLGLVTGASAMGAVFAMGVGTVIVTASPDEIVAGMRATVAGASILVAMALLMTIRHQRSIAASAHQISRPHDDGTS